MKSGIFQIAIVHNASREKRKEGRKKRQTDQDSDSEFPVRGVHGMLEYEVYRSQLRRIFTFPGSWNASPDPSP